ncbi:cellulose biosynthesis protein BcsQ [Agromyces flavus]|uniref:Cellulose biosynthesis protein BcsQ n=1 Tax=Agromyces flavus TaxID=589382 RepID=A0ABT1KIW3_9MICO|nr:cellulose biosynthesis protein BcsQ [Agromyces flavus]
MTTATTPGDLDAPFRPPSEHAAPTPPAPTEISNHDRAVSPSSQTSENERYAPPSSVDRPTSVPSSPTNTVAGPPPHAPGFDWDAATAAALSDEQDSGVPTGSVPTTHRSDPDKLLEDIIREIVGDATAETVSSLHQPRAVQEQSTDEAATPVSTTPRVVAVDQLVESASPAPELDDEYRVFDEPAGDGAEAGAQVSVQPITADLVPRAAADDGQQSTDAATAALAYSPVAAPSTVAEPPADVSRETHESSGGTPLADQLADETRRRLALAEAVLPLPASTRIFTISNQKGGVGKTTSAVNLAAALARTGAKVLVIDLDPQGNASTALGVEHRSDQQSVYDVLVSDLPLADVVRSSTEHERLDCVPATIHLAGAEIELVSLVAREQRLRRALDAHLDGMDQPYDYVFIDCPPSLGLLTINAFVAAREVLIPIQCEYYALEGLSQLLSNIELIERHLNPELRLTTILLTMYDSRTNLAQQVAQEVRDHFPGQTLETIIPRSVRVSEAPSYGQSVISYDFASSGSLSYREAAAEIAWRGASADKEHD